MVNYTITEVQLNRERFTGWSEILNVSVYVRNK